MTQDEIIRMAREAGCVPRRHPEFDNDIQVFANPLVLVRFAQLVAEHEREACAKVCDEWHEKRGLYGMDGVAKELRARGKQ